MRKALRFWLSVCLMLAGLSQSIGLLAYEYGAREDVAQWIAKPATSKLCQLHHPLPDYGEAIFSQSATQGLTFELSSFRPLVQADQVIFAVAAPGWLHHIESRQLAVVNGQVGAQPVLVGEPLAALLLDELQGGLFPVITHQGWSADHPVDVAVSAVNFAEAYAAFQTCVSNLLPPDFADITRLTVLFDTDKTDIAPAYQRLLKQLVAYVLKDNAIRSQSLKDDFLKEESLKGNGLKNTPAKDQGLQHIVLAGHTDSVWKRDYNVDLSRRRAEAVKDFLLGQGLEESQLQIEYYGESKPLVLNNSPANRRKNRRVTITLEKPVAIEQINPAKASSEVSSQSSIATSSELTTQAGVTQAAETAAAETASVSR